MIIRFSINKENCLPMHSTCVYSFVRGVWGILRFDVTGSIRHRSLVWNWINGFWSTNQRIICARKDEDNQFACDNTATVSSGQMFVSQAAPLVTSLCLYTLDDVTAWNANRNRHGHSARFRVLVGLNGAPFDDVCQKRQTIPSKIFKWIFVSQTRTRRETKIHFSFLPFIRHFFRSSSSSSFWCAVYGDIEYWTVPRVIELY